MASNGNGKVKTFIQFKKSLNLDNAYKYCLNLCLSNGNRKATKNKKMHAARSKATILLRRYYFQRHNTGP